MAKIFVKNVSKEPAALRPFATAEKVILKPGERIECDRDWVEGGCLANYSDTFRADGKEEPEINDILKWLEKATDAEKEAIAKALTPAKKSAKA